MFGLQTSRGTYWSHSKFAKFLLKKQGIKSLPYASVSEWNEWHKITKETCPKTYWFVETFLHDLQDVVNLPNDIRKHIEWYIVNRFITKSHKVVTNLKKGVWHESPELLMHSMFTILVNFVEIEKANMQLISLERDERPWWTKVRLLRWLNNRSPELGIKYLEWEISLAADTANDDEAYLCVSQSKAAQEVLDLYIWWTITRPSRQDPYDMIEYDDTKNIFELLDEDPNTETAQQRKQQYETIHMIEKIYEDEDTRMMKQLIDLRDYLWT